MSFRTNLTDMEVKPVYVKGEMLPEFIAFKVSSASRVLNKSKPGTMSNVLILNYKFNSKLQFYHDVEFQKWTEQAVTDFNAALTNEEWFVVSYGVIGTNVVCKLLSADKIQEFDFHSFDHTKHALNCAK